jgi:endonuclease/exonuclease/phosphatase family metal-dependent hydrolase
MLIKIGTFNLNNLFSRFNFKGQVKAIRDGDNKVIKSFTFDDPFNYSVRVSHNSLVMAKPEEERRRVAERILQMDLDILAVQEVEDITVLEQFVREDLKKKYPYRVLVEGNDQRLIDVGLVSRLPLGAVTSWRHAVHPNDPSKPIFSRDLLEVEILHPNTRNKILTIFNNHLKSKLVMPGEDEEETTEKSNLRRWLQADAAASIIRARMRPNSLYLVLGDMNDTPDSPQLEPLAQNPVLKLVNGLAAPQETRPAKADTPPPLNTAWTHRFKAAGKPASYELFDQIWLSPNLAKHQTAAWIHRRSTHGGDGSDHDPAWVEVKL